MSPSRKHNSKKDFALWAQSVVENKDLYENFYGEEYKTLNDKAKDLLLNHDIANFSRDIDETSMMVYVRARSGIMKLLSKTKDYVQEAKPNETTRIGKEKMVIARIDKMVNNNYLSLENIILNDYAQHTK